MPTPGGERVKAGGQWGSRSGQGKPFGVVAGTWQSGSLAATARKRALTVAAQVCKLQCSVATCC